MSKAKSRGKTAAPTAVDRLTEGEAAAELERLAREIAHHDALYYRQDAPEISDAEYDALVRRNAELEAAFPHLVREDSPSRKVGHEVAASPLSKVTHAVRMMSLDNAFADEEVADFVALVLRVDDATVADPDDFGHGRENLELLEGNAPSLP